MFLQVGTVPKLHRRLGPGETNQSLLAAGELLLSAQLVQIILHQRLADHERVDNSDTKDLSEECMSRLDCPVSLVCNPAVPRSETLGSYSGPVKCYFYHLLVHSRQGVASSVTGWR
ncbi:hypothetical protein C5167_031270 [Papaver somniferum]|nr:hypothetical protein C5167_031270 [Papaver somniferum]